MAGPLNRRDFSVKLTQSCLPDSHDTSFALQHLYRFCQSVKPIVNFQSESAHYRHVYAIAVLAACQKCHVTAHLSGVTMTSLASGGRVGEMTLHGAWRGLPAGLFDTTAVRWSVRLSVCPHVSSQSYNCDVASRQDGVRACSTAARLYTHSL